LEIKEKLRENNISYYDCNERSDFEEKLKKIYRPKHVNYLDPNNGGKKRLKGVYFEKLRDSTRVTITKEELCEKQWQVTLGGTNKFLPEFKENGTLYLSKDFQFMNYKIINNGKNIQVESYPPLSISRSANVNL
jgi:hypothetical protein